MNEIQMRAAQRALEEWLADDQELGKVPSKMECVGTFELHELLYYIFKYKKSLLGKWLLGVCGGFEEDGSDHCGHVFSEMEEYDPANAEEKCVAMVEMIREYWMKQAAGGEVGEERSGGEDQGGGGSFVGFVLLDSCQWDRRKLISDLKADWGMETTDSQEDENSLVFDLDGGIAAVSLMPAPIPDGEAVGAAETNYMWRDAVAAAKRHQAHLMVALMGKGNDPLAMGKNFVKLCDASLKQENALGIYASGTVFQPEFYHEAAEILREDGLPVLNLIHFGLYQSEEGVNGFTHGLADLGKEEIEVLGSRESAEAVRDFLFNIVCYILDGDVVLNDGETIGFTAEQMLPITRSPGVAVEGDSLKIGF